MFRLLTVLAVLISSTAAAAPKLNYVYTGNGSSDACMSGMTEAEHDKLWTQVLMELEFAGYKVRGSPHPKSNEFTNGFYYLILSKEDDGFCVTYRDAYQPQIPALYGGELFPEDSR